VELVARYYRMGVDADELLCAYPQLTPAGLFDALSYYHDHKQEIDRAVDETSTLAQIKAKFGVEVGEQGEVTFLKQRRAG
jgi:hypothetical protein